MVRKIYKPTNAGGSGSGGYMGLTEAQVNALIASKADASALVTINNSLNNKADTTLLTNQVSILNQSISNRAPLVHTHTLSQITDYTGQGQGTASAIVKPTVNTPFAGVGTTIPQNYTITSSTFALSSGSETHTSTDWQVATDLAFTNVVLSSLNNTTALTSWAVNFPSGNTTYYVKARYKGNNGTYSDWSNVTTLPPTAASGGSSSEVISTPTINPPFVMVGGTVPLENFVTTSAYSSTGTGTHDKTEYQISENSDFTALVGVGNHNLTNNYGLTGFTVYFQGNDRTFYLRVRYGSSNGVYSNWSAGVMYKTEPLSSLVVISAPVVSTPFTNVDGKVGLTNSIISSTFTLTSGTDTHAATDWQVASDSNFATPVINDWNSTSLRQWNMSFPSANTSYYVRCRYKSATGIYSNWSAGVIFRT